MHLRQAAPAVFAVLLGGMMAGCTKETVILTKEELLQYEVKTEITRENTGSVFEMYTDLFDYGNGETADCYYLQLKEGYFPGEMEIVYGNVERTITEYSFVWEDEPLVVRAAVVRADEGEEPICDTVSGYVLSYEIPAKYLREDEYGKYFCLEHEYNRYYLNGQMSYVNEDGSVQLLDHTRWPVLIKGE